MLVTSLLLSSVPFLKLLYPISYTILFVHYKLQFTCNKITVTDYFLKVTVTNFG